MRLSDIELARRIIEIASALSFGAILGSFLNVVIHRLPRDESIVRPRSRCPGCGTLIAWYRNVPVLSFAWQRGRCAACGTGISWRYPLVELLAIGATLVTYLRFGYGLAFAIYWPFVLAMIALAFIDLEHQILPDEITKGGLVIGLVASFFNPRVTPRDAFIGAALGYAVLWVIAAAYKRARGVEGMGRGDFKMLAMIGAFGGYQILLPTLFAASLCGLTLGLVLIARQRGSMQTAIPFGTFLAPAACLMVFYGPEIVRWYGEHFRLSGAEQAYLLVGEAIDRVSRLT